MVKICWIAIRSFTYIHIRWNCSIYCKSRIVRCRAEIETVPFWTCGIECRIEAIFQLIWLEWAVTKFPVCFALALSWKFMENTIVLRGAIVHMTLHFINYWARVITLSMACEITITDIVFQELYSGWIVVHGYKMSWFWYRNVCQVWSTAPITTYNLLWYVTWAGFIRCAVWCGISAVCAVDWSLCTVNTATIIRIVDPVYLASNISEFGTFFKLKIL